MQWLTAILAFATTMLIFSIVVSTLVETIHCLLKSRPKGLDEMLERFYAEVIGPYGFLIPADLRAALIPAWLMVSVRSGDGLRE